MANLLGPKPRKRRTIEEVAVNKSTGEERSPSSSNKAIQEEKRRQVEKEVLKSPPLVPILSRESKSKSTTPKISSTPRSTTSTRASSSSQLFKVRQEEHTSIPSRSPSQRSEPVTDSQPSSIVTGPSESKFQNQEQARIEGEVEVFYDAPTTVDDLKQSTSNEKDEEEDLEEAEKAKLFDLSAQLSALGLAEVSANIRNARILSPAELFGDGDVDGDQEDDGKRRHIGPDEDELLTPQDGTLTPMPERAGPLEVETTLPPFGSIISNLGDRITPNYVTFGNVLAPTRHSKAHRGHDMLDWGRRKDVERAQWARVTGRVMVDPKYDAVTNTLYMRNGEPDYREVLTPMVTFVHSHLLESFLV